MDSRKEKIMNQISTESNRGKSRLGFFGVVVLLVLIGFAFTGGKLAEELTHHPKSLSDDVATAPRSGIVVSNVGNDVCLVLFDEKGTPDDTISCAKKSKIINLDHQLYGQKNILAAVGDRYEVRRFEVSGVIEGLIFVPPIISE